MSLGTEKKVVSEGTLKSSPEYKALGFTCIKHYIYFLEVFEKVI